MWCGGDVGVVVMCGVVVIVVWCGVVVMCGEVW